MSVAMRAQTRVRLDFTPRDDLPAHLVPDPDFARIIPAKAPLLRKLIGKAFKEMFATKTSRLPSGETAHSGVFEGTAIRSQDRLRFAPVSAALWGEHSR